MKFQALSHRVERSRTTSRRQMARTAQATNPRLVLGFDSDVLRQTLNIETGSAL